MGQIKQASLPKTESGNDPADHRGQETYLSFLDTTPLADSGLADIEEALLQKPTEDKVALMFAHKHEGKLIYSHQHATWFKWQGTHWLKEETMLAQEYVRKLSRQLNSKGLTNLGRSGFIKGVESLAKGDRRLAVHGGELDNERYLLNTPDGTINLDGVATVSNHDPKDLITKVTSVGPSNAGGEVFAKFLDEITLGDEELQGFLQRALGSILSGAVEEHWIMFWIGEGRNGKNTLGDVIASILGQYAKQVPSSTLLSKKNDAHPTELANLQGVRLAISSEIPEGSFMNEARVKELTGDARISARYMRQNFFECSGQPKQDTFI